MEEKGKTIIGASRLGVCRTRATASAFQDRQGGRGVEWSTGRARGSPGAVARARGGGEHSRLVLPLRRLALQQPDFPEMMRPSGPMGAREQPGGGGAESGPGNPAKCLDFFAAPRTRQCALLLRRGRTCSPSLSRTELSRGGQRTPASRASFAPCAHRVPTPQLRASLPGTLCGSLLQQR